MADSSTKYKPIPSQPQKGLEMRNMAAPAEEHIVIVNANDEEGKAEIKQLEIKHKATDFADQDANNETRVREGFIKFLMRKDVPHKAVILSFSFVILGIILFLLGFVKDLQEWDPFRGFLFWCTGVILFVPGTFFVFKLIQAYTAKDVYTCKTILGEIP